MVSKAGSVGYIIIGKTADFIVVQKTVIHTIHKEGTPQKVIAKEAGCSQSAVSKLIQRKLSGRKKCGRKRCTSNRDNRSLERIVEQRHSRIWERFTRSGLRLESVHQGPPSTDIFRTTVAFLVSSHS